MNWNLKDELIVGNFLFPFSNYIFNRKNIISSYKKLLIKERYPHELMREMQLAKLRELLVYAYDFVPFYRKRFDSSGLKRDDLKNIENISMIPPLTRSDVIENRLDMLDRRFRKSAEIADDEKRNPGEPVPFAAIRKHKLVRNTSSGSTGAPTIFYEDGRVTALNWAQELRYRRWYGIEPGAKEARLARVSTEYVSRNKGLLLRRICWNQLVLPGVNLSEKDYTFSLEKLLEFRPRVLWGFTTAITGLADYIENLSNGNLAWKPDLIITWAAPMYQNEEDKLKRVFDCAVTNIYGAREVGHIGAFCPDGSLHLNQESLVVEIDPLDDGNCQENAGEILVTPLEKTCMPFIRYRMGDIGEISENGCKCGRTLQVLENFIGRTGEIFITRDGRMISPNFWCRTFMDQQLSESVRRFQVLYTREGNIKIKIVKGKTYNDDRERKLKAHLGKNFHQDIKIQFEYVDDIPPTLSGKYQMVVKET